MNKDQVNEMLSYADELSLSAVWKIKGDGYTLTINGQTFDDYRKCETYLDGVAESV